RRLSSSRPQTEPRGRCAPSPRRGEGWGGEGGRMTSLAATSLAIPRSPLAVLDSLPRPNSGLPEFGTSSCPKSDKSDFGWGRVGVGVACTSLVACPLPIPPPQAGEGTPRLQSLFNRKRACP